MICPRPAHQAALDIADGGRIAFRLEPLGYMLQETAASSHILRCSVTGEAPVSFFAAGQLIDVSQVAAV
jgi:hypothetical protein